MKRSLLSRVCISSTAAAFAIGLCGAVQAKPGAATVKAGALPVDTRSKERFDAGHIPGAVNIEWRVIGTQNSRLLLGGHSAWVAKGGPSTEPLAPVKPAKKT